MIWLYIGIVAMTFVISLVESHRHVRPVRTLSLLLGLVIMVELTGLYANETHQNMQWLYRAYAAIEYGFLGYVYSAHFSQPSLRRAVFLSVGLFAVFSIISAVWSPDLSKAPTAVYSVEWTLILLLVMLYFVELYRSDQLVSLTAQPLFWISIGNFIFYAGTFFLMGLIHQIKQNDMELAKRIFVINPILNIIMYALWSVGFLCKRIFRMSY